MCIGCFGCLWKLCQLSSKFTFKGIKKACRLWQTHSQIYENFYTENFDNSDNSQAENSVNFHTQKPWKLSHIFCLGLFLSLSAHFELSTELSTYPQKKVVFCQYSIFCQKLSTYPHFTPFIFLFLLLLFLCLLACFFTYYLKPFFCPLLAFCYLAW